MGTKETGLEANSQPSRTKGEILEGVAFTFCKVATVALIAGRFTLPVAAALAALFYAFAYVKGKRDTRCLLKYPLLIIPFWSAVSVVSLGLILNPSWWQSIKNAVFGHG